jgi:hypothetical protein
MSEIIEMDVERDRKTCVSLDLKVDGANRELAQWLLDHPRYSGAEVAGWLGCSKTRINDLRSWAKGGFVVTPTQARKSRHDDRRAGQSAQKSQENSEGAASVEEIETESPDKIVTNFLDKVSRHAAVLRAYKKVFGVSALDQAQKDEVRTAIGRLITKWQSLERGLGAWEKKSSE